MGEFSSRHDIPNADLVTAGANNPVSVVVPIPVGAMRWTLLTVPKDGGAAPDPTFLVEYDVGGGFFPTNPATSGTAVRNQANVLTREDVVVKIRVTVTNGASIIDGDVLIRLYIAR